MANIELIINAIDVYLEKTNLRELSAVDANALLAKLGILGDSNSRPGLPLRNILRDGLIPHAYQIPAQKNGRWFIPHS